MTPTDFFVPVAVCVAVSIASVIWGILYGRKIERLAATTHHAGAYVVDVRTGKTSFRYFNYRYAKDEVRRIARAPVSDNGRVTELKTLVEDMETATTLSLE